MDKGTNDTLAQLALAARQLQSGDYRACQDICNGLLSRTPVLLAAMNLRGLALAQAGEYAAGIRDLSRVWPAQAQNKQAALWLGRLYRIQGEYALAVPPLQAAATEPSLEPDARYELARALTRLRKTSEAIDQYRLILKLQPAHVDAMANLAFLLERANRLQESEHLADLALQSNPHNFMAQLTKATLERRNGSPGLAQSRLETTLRGQHSAMNQSILLNQAGQCQLAQDQFQAAFESFERGNVLLREQHPLGKPVEDGSYGLKTIFRLKTWLSANPPSRWSATPSDNLSPPLVFLLGFPRSGTTLMDQALSAHPDVEVLEEFEFFDAVRRDWVDGEAIQKLAQMSPQDLQSARQQYLQALQARRSTDKPCVVDKLPLNMIYLFLIHRLFPDARILFMLRDPRDVCLSCFFQSFDLQGAMPYFLDLQQTADYYDAAMSLAQYSLKQISNPVFFQRYENLVTDFRPAMQATLEFLELPWNESILEYRQNAQNRVIDTPSYQQVVRPLYQDSIARWRYFPAPMEPLQSRLGPWIEFFDYPAI